MWMNTKKLVYPQITSGLLYIPCKFVYNTCSINICPLKDNW